MAGIFQTLKQKFFQGVGDLFEAAKNCAVVAAKAINRNKGKFYAGSTAALLVIDTIAVPPSIIQIPGKILLASAVSLPVSGLFYLASHIAETLSVQPREYVARNNLQAHIPAHAPVVGPNPPFVPVNAPVNSVAIGAPQAVKQSGRGRKKN